jgi:hypothetical protein
MSTVELGFQGGKSQITKSQIKNLKLQILLAGRVGFEPTHLLIENQVA